MASEIIPDVFHWVELGRIGWQRHERDVVGDQQSFAFLVPSSTVADQQAMRAGGNLGAAFGEMLIHRLDVHPRHDDRCTDATCRANRAEDVNRIMAIVAHHRRARSDRCPDIFNRTFLADPGFVLEPDFNRLAGHPGRQNIQAQAREVFLKAACAARSFFG